MTDADALNDLESAVAAPVDPVLLVHKHPDPATQLALLPRLEDPTPSVVPRSARLGRILRLVSLSILALALDAGEELAPDLRDEVLEHEDGCRRMLDRAAARGT